MKLSSLLTAFSLALGLTASAKVDEPQAIGDLVFRDSDHQIYGRESIGLDMVKNHPGHVGIYVGRGMVIHALAYWDLLVYGEFGYWGFCGEVVYTTLAPVAGQRSFYDDEDMDGEEDHGHMGAKTHQELRSNPQADVLRANIRHLAFLQVGAGYDNNFSVQKGPGSDEWSCCGLTEKVYESCASPTELVYPSPYSDEAGYSGGLNITTDGVASHYADGFFYYQNAVEFSQIPSLLVGPMGRTFPDYPTMRFVFFPYTQFQQSTLIDAFLLGPVSLSAGAVSPGQINLTWVDKDEKESGFKIQRSLGPSGPWLPITTTHSNVTIYSDSGLTANHTYYYRVIAYNSSGSTTSSVVHATTPPAAGTSHTLSITTVNPASGVYVATWTGTASYDDGYSPLSRSFGHGATVGVLCLDTLSSGQYFQKWQLDGIDYSYDYVTSVVMNGDHTLKAVYGAVPAPVRILSGLAIEGPTGINERSSDQYQALASYSDGSSDYVTPDYWDDDSDYVSISSSGLLDAGAVNADEVAIVEISFTEGGVTRTATRSVTIYNTDAVPTYTLTCNSTVGGSIGYSPHASRYAAGSVVSLHGNPYDDYVFDYWSGDASGTEDDITITMNGNRSVTAHFTLDTSYGRLQVNLFPQQAVDEGAQWKYNTFTAWRDSGNIQDGITPRTNKNVYFKDIPGWIAPDNVKASVIGGRTTVTNATYREILGGVQVVITPDQANVAGARWKLDGGAWTESGVTLTDVSAGSHSVQFLSVNGWTAPTSQTVSVARGVVSARTGDYVPPPGFPIITSVSPRTGPIEGGTEVTIDGVNFQSGASVTFGGIAAASLTVENSTRITAVTPSRASYGTVALALTSGGQTVTQGNGFSYLNALGSNIELVGQIGGIVEAVAVVGNTVYYGEGPALVVSDFSNSASPVERGRIALPAFVKDLAVVNNIAFVAAGAAGLYAVDVSIPTAPSIVGFFDTEGSAWGVTVSGGLAYVADYDAGLQILDVTNSAAIVRRGLLDMAGNAARVSVGTIASKQYAFVAENSSGAALRVIDVTTPSCPIERTSTPATSDAGISDVKLVGTKLYASFWGDVKIFDVSNPTNLIQTGTFNYGAVGGFLDVVGNRLYSCDGFFAVGDLTVSPNPTKLGDFYPGSFCYKLVVTNNLAYVAMGGDGLKVVNVSNPASISLRSSVSTLGDIADVWVSSNVAFVGNNSGLHSLDVSNPARPVRLATLTGNGVENLVVANGKATLVASGDVEVRIANVANPAALTLFGTYTNVRAEDVALMGNTPVLAARTRDAALLPKLDVLDISSPSNPQSSGSLVLDTTSGAANAITVVGSWAFVGRRSKALDVVSLANPASPQKVGSATITNTFRAVAVSENGNFVYVGDMTLGIQVVDVTVKTAPILGQVVDPLQTSGKGADAVRVSGNRLFAYESGYIFVFDITDPASPQIIGYYDVPGSGSGIAVVGDLIFVVAGNAGVTILRLKDVGKPTLAITSPTVNPAYATTNGVVSVGGTASDDKGVVRVSWLNDRGGGGVAQGTTTWAISNLLLAAGLNRVTVTAEDANGNLGADVIEITAAFADATPPVVTITSPKLDSEFTVDIPTITLSGSASDNQAVAGMTCGNNFSAAGAVTLVGPNWSVTNLQLALGPNFIQVTARDASGNSAADTAVVFFVPPDTNAPSIAIDFPTLNSTYETGDASINLSGEAGDDNQVSAVEWARNGGTQGVANGISPWSVNDIPLQPGFNLIEISAKDAAGNISVDTLAVTYTPRLTGSLSVTLDPADAISAGAKWQVDGDDWHNSGETVSDLDVGDHTVAYIAIGGYTAPSNQTVVISEGSTTCATGTYSATPPALSVTPPNQDFGPTLVGTVTDRTFAITNSGGGVLSGSASVPAPFSILSGGIYSLGRGEGQMLTVRYSPQAPGSHSNDVELTGGEGASLPVTGNAYVMRSLVVDTPYGVALPPVGTNMFPDGIQIDASVTNSPVSYGSTQYLCTGWAGGGSVSELGHTTDTGPFTLSTNSSITWLWETNYWLQTATGVGGGRSTLVSNVASSAASITNSWSGWQLAGTTYVIMTNSASVVTSPTFSTRGFTNLTVDFMARSYGTVAGTTRTNITISISTNNGTDWTILGVVAPTNNAFRAQPALTNKANLGFSQTRIRWQTLGAASGGGVGVSNLVVRGWCVGGSGTVNLADGWWPKDSNVQITATAGDHCVFSSWTGQTNSCAISGNVIGVPMIQPRVVTANFVKVQCSLTVTTPYGGAMPAAGTNWFDLGSTATAWPTSALVANGSTQFVCQGWIGTGSVPAFGTGTNTGPFILADDSQLMWLWNTNFWLHVDMSGDGMVSTNNTWLVAGTNIQVTATPAIYFTFGEWRGQTNGCTMASNSIMVAMDGARTVEAIFSADLATNNVPKWWLAQHDLTNFNADAMGDDDGDGIPTWQEWISGSDPTNFHSIFQFTNEACVAGQGMAIRWPSISNRFYNLSRATNLVEGSNAFMILPGASNMPATPPENCYTNEDQYDGFYFFRIGVRE